MARYEALRPVRMDRIAIVAPESRFDAVLRLVADAGQVELDVAPDAPVREVAERAEVRDGVAAIAGWAPSASVDRLAELVAAEGGSIVRLERPRGVEVPSLLRGGEGVRGSLASLVTTYGAVPYTNLDPTPVAAAAYMLMFGAMFGDVGHGLVLIAAAIALRLGRPRRLARFRRAWPFALGAGAASVFFGLLYGEAFGPTGLVPVLWLEPLEHPIPLLLAALGMGACLLGVAYLLGTINRMREGGLRLALYSPAGIAGSAVFFGLGLVAGGWYLGLPWLAAGGGALALAGLVLAFGGFLAEAGGGAAGVAQAAMEVFDVLVSLGSNVASFARLAAFGLTHAAIGSIVWQGASDLWPGNPVGAVAVFVAGNAVALTLEGLVVGVQALRLEYYELFSRIFQVEGRPFRPWHIPLTSKETVPCPYGSGEGSTSSTSAS